MSVEVELDVLINAKVFRIHYSKNLILQNMQHAGKYYRYLPVLEELRMSGKLILHFLRENQVLDKKSNSAQLMAYQMFVMMAASYAHSISDNVKRGFSEKRRNGESLGMCQ